MEDLKELLDWRIDRNYSIEEFLELLKRRIRETINPESKINNMTPEELKKRTLKFGVDIAFFCKIIYPDSLLRAYTNQLIRASSSVGANYRAACRAKSGKDFVNKLKIVEEECDECMFFMELIREIKPDSASSIEPMWKEANEILSIVVASIGTARRSLNQSKNS